MGLLDLLKIFDGKSPYEKDKETQDKLFMDEAKAYGLTKEEIEECKKSGITPAEWVEDNDNKK